MEPDVIGTPPAEAHRTFQRCDQGVIPVGSAQAQDRGDLGVELGDPGRGGPDQELLGDRTQRQELLLGDGAPTSPAAGRGRPWPVVVGVVDAGLAGRHQPVLGMDLTGDRLDDPQDPVAFVDQHRYHPPDEPVGHRVARGPEPDAGELVDLPDDRRGTDLRP